MRNLEVPEYNMKALFVCLHIVLAAQLCSTLCDPMDCGLPGSSVHGILQAKILEWVAMHSSRNFPNPGIEPSFLTSPALAGRFFTTRATWEAPEADVYQSNTVR